MNINSVEDYKKYIKDTKNEIRFFRVLILVVFLLVWEMLARLNIIDSFLFSSPSRVFAKFIELVSSGELIENTKITLSETLVAFVLSTSIGIMLGILFWYFEKLKNVFDPYLVLLNSIPKTAIAPMIIVWFGIGYKSIVFVAISIGVFATTMAYLSALSEIDEDKIKLIYVLGGNKKDVLFKLVLPYSIPSIISVSKINIGLSLIGVIIGEFLVAQKGLGYMIIYGSQIFDLNSVILSLCILSLISYMFYFILERIEKRVVKNK